jgi:hypothetical protein
MKTNIVISNINNNKKYYLQIMYDKNNIQYYETDISELYNCNCNFIKRFVKKIWNQKMPCNNCYNILINYKILKL